MTESVAARLKALEENYNKRGALAELAAIRAEVEAMAKDMRETAMRKAPVSRVMNPISAADAWAWADRLASEGK